MLMSVCELCYAGRLITVHVGKLEVKYGLCGLCISKIDRPANYGYLAYFHALRSYVLSSYRWKAVNDKTSISETAPTMDVLTQGSKKHSLPTRSRSLRYPECPYSWISAHTMRFQLVPGRQPMVR